MPTLNLSAPRNKVGQEPYTSFQEILNRRIGKAYFIAKKEYDQLSPGCKVVLLSNDEKRRAEGTLRELRCVGTMNAGGKGMKKYDVHIKDLQEVAYRRERLTHRGVSIT
jgi:hypothetical protein